MDFVRRIRKKTSKKKVRSLEQLYKFNVKLYDDPPTKDVELLWLEHSVVERLKVLHILEQIGGKRINNDCCEDWRKRVLIEMKLQKLAGFVNLIELNPNEDPESLLLAREMDYISHFVMRLYFCESDVLRQWFVDREIEFFRLKFHSLSLEEKQNFLEENHLSYRLQNFPELTSETHENDSQNTQFFKVKFTEVLTLVSERKCNMKSGFAYVTDLSSIIETIQRNIIEKGLMATHRMLNKIREDLRIKDLMKTIHNSRPGQDLESMDETLNFIESADFLSTQYFPLCARICHETLREKHHLKYFGRNQYQLFLKGIGVSLQESLKFWIEEFNHKYKNQPLPAKYRYQIEFNYGKRGSKIDIAPPSCSNLISMHFPSFQQCYGCPYKFLDSSELQEKLTSQGLNSIQVEEVLNYSNKNDYQLACSKYFEIMNNHKPNEIISSPNRYFDLCQTVKRLKSIGTDDISAKNISFNDSLYDKHLWNMRSPDEQNLQKPDSITDFMTQMDLNF